MEGFRPAVDGQFDVADQLTRYLQKRAAEAFATTRAEKRAIDSRHAFEARREQVRETFHSAIGGLPNRPDDTVAETSPSNGANDRPTDSGVQSASSSGAGGIRRLCALRSWRPSTLSTCRSSISSARAVADFESGPSTWSARIASSVS